MRPGVGERKVPYSTKGEEDMTSHCTVGHIVRVEEEDRYPDFTLAIYHSCYRRGVSYSRGSYKVALANERSSVDLEPTG